MADSSLATAADYADAMLTARRAKNWLFLILLLLLLAQLTIFFLYHYGVIQLLPHSVTALPTSAPFEVVPQRENPLRYVIGLCDFVGMALAIVLMMVLLLIEGIMLVGRLIGVSRMTSAYIWTLILAVLLFPWQAFLEQYAFKIPGVLYTWNELVALGRWSELRLEEQILRWARFVAFPVVAVVILLAVQVMSNRALRQALGEAPPEAARE